MNENIFTTKEITRIKNIKYSESEIEEIYTLMATKIFNKTLFGFVEYKLSSERDILLIQFEYEGVRDYTSPIPFMSSEKKRKEWLKENEIKRIEKFCDKAELKVKLKSIYIPKIKEMGYNYRFVVIPKKNKNREGFIQDKDSGFISLYLTKK